MATKRKTVNVKAKVRKAWACLALGDEPRLLWPTRLDARMAAMGRRVVRVQVKEIGK